MIFVLLVTLCSAAAALARSNTTKQACPSLYGPGKHSIQLQIQDPGGSRWERSFEVYVAPDLSLTEQRPTVLMWHGCGSDPEKFEQEAEMDKRVGKFGFYSIYPRGTSRNLPGPACRSVEGGVSCGWNAGASPGGCQTATNPAPNDVYFSEQILNWMSANLCVDMDRVFIGGFSNGAQFIYKLNCQLSQRFAGVATNGMPARDAGTPGAGSCQPQRALPAINFCGSEDFTNCYGNKGAGVISQVNAFAAFNGCVGELEARQLSSTTTCWSATRCPDSRAVQGCAIMGLEHCWPMVPGAGNPECQNQNPANVDASSYLLEFFAALPKGSFWDK